MSGGGATVATPAAGFSPATILARIKTVDGTGSGLDADLVRGTTPSTAGLSILALASIAVGGLLLGSGTNAVGTLAIGAASTFLKSNGTTAAWTALDAGDLGTGTLAAARGGTGVSNAGTLTNASNTTITGGGTLALGGFTLTVPATGTAGLLGTANVWTAANTFSNAAALALTSATGTTLAISSTNPASITCAGGILVAGAVNEQTLRCGSFGIQSYATANSWFGDNTYFNGSNFVYRSNGDAGMVRWNSGSWQIQAANTGTAGATASFAELNWNYSSVLTVGSASAGQISVPHTTGVSITLASTDAASITTAGGISAAGAILAPAATTSIPSVRLPHGTAPSSPTNGDMWTTTAGLFVRINGATIGPLS
jgi:hypothetical protein